MARVREPTKEEEEAWKKWVATRPPKVRAVAEQFDPWSLYRMRDTGHRVMIYSFGEEKEGDAVTLCVAVTAEYDRLANLPHEPSPDA